MSVVTRLCAVILIGNALSFSAGAQLVTAKREYVGPVVSNPVDVRYGWRSARDSTSSRIAVSYGRWDGAGEVCLYDAETGELIDRFASALGVRGLVGLPGGKEFATGDFSGNVVIRRFEDGAITSQWQTPKGSVEMLVFSSDGSECFFCSNGDYVARADAVTGEVKMLYDGHTDNIYDVALSADETKLVSSATNGVIVVSEVDSGKRLHQLSHPGQVAAVHWLGDSKRFVSVSSDARLCQWDSESGELLNEVKSASSLFSVDVDLASNTIATGGRGDIHFWDTETLQPKWRDRAGGFQGHTSLVFGVQLLPDGTLLSSGWDKQAYVWDIDSGAATQILDPSSGNLAGVTALGADREMSRVLAARTDGTLNEIDPKTLRTLRSFEERGEGVRAIEILGRNNCWLGRDDGALIRFSLAEGQDNQAPEQIAKFDSAVLDIASGQGGQGTPTLAVATSDGALHWMDTESGKRIHSLAASQKISSAVWLPDGKSLAVLTPENLLQVWTTEGEFPFEVKTGRTLQLPAADDSRLVRIADGLLGVDFGAGGGMIFDVDAFQFVAPIPRQATVRSALVASGDGTSLITGTKSGGLALYEAQLPPIAASAQTRLKLDEVRLLCFSPDGSKLLVGSIKGDMTEVSGEDLSSLSPVKRRPPFGMASSARSADREWIAVGEWGGDVLLSRRDPFAIAGQLPPKMEKKTGSAGALAIANDRKRVVVGSRDGQVRMYQVEPPELVWESEAFGAPINEVALSDDGRYVTASTGDYRQYRDPGLTVLLDAKTGKTTYSWDDAKEKVTGVAFSPDSKLVLSCGGDGLRTYDVESGELLHKASLFGGQRVRFVDETRCVVTANPGRIVLWDSRAKREIVRFLGHQKPAGEEKEPMVWGVDVSDDGKKLVTGDVFGQVYLWPLP